MTTHLCCRHCWDNDVSTLSLTSLLMYSPDSRTFFCTPGAYDNACGMRLCDFACVFFCMSCTWLKYIKIDLTMGMFLSHTAKAVMDNSTRIHGKLHPMHLASNWKSSGGIKQFVSQFSSGLVSFEASFTCKQMASNSYFFS